MSAWIPARLRPNLGPWVEVKEFAARGGRGYAMVANGRDLVYYRIGLPEAALLPLLDGTRTTAEVLVEHLRTSGELDFAAVAGLVRTLHEGGFLTDAPVDVGAALQRALAPRGLRARISRIPPHVDGRVVGRRSTDRLAAPSRLAVHVRSSWESRSPPW